MSSKPHTGVGTVSAQVAALPALPMAELWALWDQHFPRRPKHINRSFLESRLAYRVFPDGRIHVGFTFEPKGEGLPDLPRVGLRWAMAGALDQVAWFGRGPWENYWDRKTGAAVDRYQASVGELIHDYLEPQENGNRGDVRWVSFVDEQGRGVKITGDSLVAFSAWPYTQEVLEAAKHPYDLARSGNVHIQVDAGQMGVGGDDSWGARPHPQYTLPADRPYPLAFTLELLRR